MDIRGTLPTRPGYAPYPRRNINAVDSVDIHYTAGPYTSSTYDIAAYQTGPTAQLDFPEIAYHLMVEADGTVYWCHDLNKRTWHNGASGRNERAVGICFVGNGTPLEAQKVGIRQAIQWSQEHLGRQLAVSGHKDTYPTACPGAAWPSWKSEILP